MIIAIDYASVDGNARPDYAKAKAACAAAGSSLAMVILRSAWGTSPDPTIHRDWKAAMDAGLTVGGYLFLRMPVHGYTASPEDQVHVCMDNMPALTHANLPPVIDVEDEGLEPEAELAWVHRAWTEMRTILGVPPIIYDSDRVWREDLGNLPPAGEMLESPQWVAKPWPWPIRHTPILSGGPFAGGQYDAVVPPPWGPGNWWLHQYQGDAFGLAGFTSTVDLSRFHLMIQGDVGPRVAWAQRRMGIPATSRFDVAMASQVRAFQRQNGLVVDGVIGPQTFRALCWCPALDLPTAA